MPRRKPVEEFSDTIRLSSKVAITIHTTEAIYDTLEIQRVGGRLIIALPDARQGGMSQPFTGGESDTPADPESIGLAHARLLGLFPQGPTAPVSRAVTPADLGFPAITPESLSGGGFSGTSNEDDPDA